MKSLLWLCLAIGASACGGSRVDLPASLPFSSRKAWTWPATEALGPLKISATESEGLESTSRIRPWSGYWYPLSDDLLVRASSRNGGQSTLQKADLYFSNKYGQRISSVDEEISNGEYIESQEIGWQGRCNAWAFASILEPEPVIPQQGVLIDRVHFFTRDFKALLIKSYEWVDEQAVQRFGQRFQGADAEDYQDLYPDQFHRVLQSSLIDKSEPFLMDTDAGIEVWNKPVWKSVVRVIPDSIDVSLLHVETALWAVMSETISADDVGTRNKTYIYTYDLIGDRLEDGRWEIRDGKWTGDSVRDHPDFVTLIRSFDARVKHQSKNRSLHPDWIEELISHAQGR